MRRGLAAAGAAGGGVAALGDGNAAAAAGVHGWPVRARAAGAAQRFVCIAGTACAAGVGGASGPVVARGRAVLVGVARRVRCAWVGRTDGACFSGRARLAIPPD